MEPCGDAPQGGGHAAEVHVLNTCVLTWSRALLLPALAGGPLEDWHLHTPLSVVTAHQSPSLTLSPALQWVAEAGRGRETRGGIRYLLEHSGIPGCHVEAPILRGAVGSRMCRG